MRPQTIEEREEALQRFERATELPMLALALVFVPVLLLPWLFDLTPGWERSLEGTGWVIWGIFAAELAARTYLAPARLRFLQRNWFDVLIVVLPFLRPLRLVRSARALRALRLARVAAPLMRATASSREILTRRGLHYLLLSTLVVMAIAAALALLFERNATDATITDYPSAIWWALATMTTVGYGDVVPVTIEGRGIGVFLMLIGIALFGVITANIAAFFVEDSNDSSAVEPADREELLATLRRLEARLADGNPTDTGEPAVSDAPSSRG